MTPDTIKISQLDSDSTPSTSDLIPLVNGSTLATQKSTLGSILALIATGTDGWSALPYIPNTITNNGNRSSTWVFNGVDLTGTLSNGMRLRATRSVAAPTKCTSLNGSTQYYSRPSPAGMAFTDTVTGMAWIKPTAYQAAGVISRYNGTNGLLFYMNSSGQMILQYGTGSKSVIISQSVPLNTWTHFAITVTGTTGTAYINGMPVPFTLSGSGTFTQAGNLEVGSFNGGNSPFPGKIAQAALFNAVLSQATILSYISQGLTGTETSLVSAYSFNNSVNDLNTTNANNLTANGSALATNVDAPWTQDDTGTPGGTFDYGIITSKAFSTNTTITVQAPEGCAIPTSGGVSAVSYSTNKTPYGFRGSREKWGITLLILNQLSVTVSSTSTWYNPGGLNITVPIGSWTPTYSLNSLFVTASATTFIGAAWTLSSASNSETNPRFTKKTPASGVSVTEFDGPAVLLGGDLNVSTATPYYLNGKPNAISGASVMYVGTYSDVTLYPAAL